MRLSIVYKLLLEARQDGELCKWLLTINYYCKLTIIATLFILSGFGGSTVFTYILNKTVNTILSELQDSKQYQIFIFEDHSFNILFKDSAYFCTDAYLFFKLLTFFRICKSIFRVLWSTMTELFCENG